MIYSDLVDEFPQEMREPMFRLVDRLLADMSDTPTRKDVHRLETLLERQSETLLALAQTQIRTEQRLESLTQRVDELAQAQQRTEQRVEELAQAQARTEQRVEELAQAQIRTEQRLESLTQRVDELAQAQKRTEERMEQLIEAQIQTEKRLTRLEVVVDRLVGEVKTIRKEVGGLSHTVGYRLEDEAMWALPQLLPRDHSVEVQGQLRRGFLTLSGGKTVEVNIHGQGARAGMLVTILGEAKTQLKKRDVDDFLSLVKLVSLSTDQPVFPLLVTYQTSPTVEEYARDRGVVVYFSYQLKPV